jgi:hypothetical protein
VPAQIFQRNHVREFHELSLLEVLAQPGEERVRYKSEIFWGRQRSTGCGLELINAITS